METNEKKYELVEQPTFYGDRELHRIRALRDFGCIKKGDLGGYIQSEDNLSHKGDCWVADDAKVYDEACVSGNALIYNEAEVFGMARVSGDAEVYDNARVFGVAHVHELGEVSCRAEVFGYADISGTARLSQHARVYGTAEVFGEAEIYGRAQIFGSAKVFGKTRVFGSTQIYDKAKVFDDAVVDGNSQVYGNANVDGNAHISDDAIVASEIDYIVFNHWWESSSTHWRYFTWTRSNNRWCIYGFCGTAEELLIKVREDIENGEKNAREYERAIKYVESILVDAGEMEATKSTRR